ncbi:MAG: hypothetical protein HC933_10740 [Pleurocapsa sp. SU_196_0]|nr:hypothetical protein [Pleurocapsa sp. SU_196_0]
MTQERHLSERNRLTLERSRDALFEAKVILAELNRDNSVSAQQRRSLEADISTLEAELEGESFERALTVRDRARNLYAPPTFAAMSI